MALSFERLGVITGAIIGVVTIGGFLGYGAPWASRAEAQTLEQSLKKFEADQDVRDKSTQANIDLLFLSQLRTESANANIKAAAHPHDAAAKADAWFAQKKLDIFFKAHPNLASAMGQ